MGHPVRAPRRPAIKRPLAVLIAAFAVLAVAIPAIAASGTVEVPKKFSKLIPKVKAKSGLPVRLPSTLHVLVKPAKTYADSSATRKSYLLELDAAKNCGGANACFLASFSGRRGGTPGFKKTVRLRGGITGYFRNVSCGASCSPAFIQWIENGVLYEIENKDIGRHAKKAMVKTANSAIKAGDR